MSEVCVYNQEIVLTNVLYLLSVLVDIVYMIMR